MTMQEKLSFCCIVLLSIGLTGCGQQQQSQDQNWHLNTDGKYVYNGSEESKKAQAEEEGPQYQQPNMEVLQGKPQKFPSKFPVTKYPRAQVAMVDVKPNRPAGAYNQVLMKTVDNIPDVERYYQTKLMTEQWKKVSEIKNRVYESTKWEKDNMQCEVRIAQDYSQPNGKRFVQLLYCVKPKKRLFKQPFIAPPQQGKPGSATVTYEAPK